MILYLCDGKDERCSKVSCYLNGGPCRHTSNVSNAKNFKDSMGADNTMFKVEGDGYLNDKEKGFLISCIIEAASEGFQHSPRYNTKYCPETGVKYKKLNMTEIVDLVRKIGGDEDDLKELFSYF